MTSCYWVFNERQAIEAASAWATDYRHDDLSDAACRARLDTIRAFLFSRQCRKGGLIKNAHDKEETT